MPNFDTIDPDLKPMFQDSTNVGIEYQLTPTTALGVNYVHNKLTRAIEDVGSLDATGNEVYFAANPGEGVATDDVRDRADAPFATPKPLRQYDAVDVTISRRFSNNWFGSANLTISRLYGNYSGLANSDEITTPTTGTSSATAQQQTGSIARPGTAAGRAWDLDELEWDSHGNLDVRRPPGDRSSGRREVLRRVSAALRHAGRRLPLRRQRHADEHRGQHDQHHPGAGQRPRRHGPHADADPNRPAGLARTGDGGRAAAALRAERVNLFNQKTATHIFNSLNKGAGLAQRRFGDDLSQRRSGARATTTTR